MAAFTEAPTTVGNADGGHTRRTLALSGDAAPGLVTGGGHSRRLFSHVLDPNTDLDVGGYHERRQFRFGSSPVEDLDAQGIPLPTGQFRQVTVVIEDVNGDPIPEAEWVRSAGIFPTSARVQVAPDGTTYARLWLLQVAYDSMALTARSGGVVYVWDEQPGDDDETGIGSNESTKTLTFKKTFKRGLKAINGVDAGGDLQL